MTYPWMAAAIVGVLMLLAIWLLPKLFRFVRRLLRALSGASDMPTPASGDKSAR